MSSKSKKRPNHDVTVNKAVSNALVIFLWAFCEEFSPDEDLVERFGKQLQSVRDSVMCGALTVPQIRKALKDEFNWEVG